MFHTFIEMWILEMSRRPFIKIDISPNTMHTKSAPQLCYNAASPTNASLRTTLSSLLYRTFSMLNPHISRYLKDLKGKSSTKKKLTKSFLQLHTQHMVVDASHNRTTTTTEECVLPAIIAHFYVVSREKEVWFKTQRPSSCSERKRHTF